MTFGCSIPTAFGKVCSVSPGHSKTGAGGEPRLESPAGGKTEL